MIFWEIFLAFFIPGIVGYGGGPATIPLIQYEVVDRYGWLTIEEFGNMLALGNALPGPIATKMAGFIGYQVGGVTGAIIALLATVAPSLIAMMALMGILYKYKDSPRVKKMTALIRPTIGVMLGLIGYQFVINGYMKAGIWHTIILIAVSFLLMEKWKVHPALVIVGTLAYGGIVLG
ncbi:chromate transporter [Ammoniphilus sp. CFH 90114]|uniref:chromate transporter n=1 Tax=Ammoniphilus sp. CFH 90114 TaxID=2493665 RepID=UPI00100F8E08|nr:chromate transporter [Ammoniphilus sp. CFH 90114]RXT08757.1 chromate transporter [Ammoniphilus sp. CFH 90114]